MIHRPATLGAPAMKYARFIGCLLAALGGFNLTAQTPTFFTNSRLVLGTKVEKSASVSLGDVDNDGDLDAVVANGRHWPGQNRIFLNNGDRRSSAH